IWYSIGVLRAFVEAAGAAVARRRRALRRNVASLLLQRSKNLRDPGAEVPGRRAFGPRPAPQDEGRR
ncbi:MAG: hypothetical protein ACK5YM_00025, partial [Pseudomonadota bacterium]